MEVLDVHSKIVYANVSLTPEEIETLYIVLQGTVYKHLEDFSPTQQSDIRFLKGEMGQLLNKTHPLS